MVGRSHGTLFPGVSLAGSSEQKEQPFGTLTIAAVVIAVGYDAVLVWVTHSMIHFVSSAAAQYWPVAIYMPAGLSPHAAPSALIGLGDISLPGVLVTAAARAGREFYGGAAIGYMCRLGAASPVTSLPDQVIATVNGQHRLMGGGTGSPALPPAPAAEGSPILELRHRRHDPRFGRATAALDAPAERGNKAHRRDSQRAQLRAARNNRGSVPTSRR